MSDYVIITDEGIRYRISFPTEESDDKTAVVDAYQGRRRIGMAAVTLSKIPHWSNKRHTFILGSENRRNLDEIVAGLTKELSHN